MDEMPVGKYKGVTIEEIILEDVDYIHWAIDNIDWFEGELTEEVFDFIEDEA